MHSLPSLFRRCLIGAALCATVHSTHAAEVHLKQTATGWQLQRNGQPYFIKGAGGADHLDQLVKCGGNSIRTWDAKGIDELLDRADKLGLTVTVGIWLGQVRQGFDYGNAAAVTAQHKRALRYIEQFKDHPAVLMWGLGNESEGAEDPAYWEALEHLAAVAKKIDPAHPTMTVMADLGGSKVQHLHALCPSLDVVGLNSYGGAPSIGTRYRAAGGTKPYVLTEFGPLGQWEVGKTDWGAPREQTSTEKAAHYRESYEKAVLGNSKLCLGSYVFLWGRKQEVTSTWYSMFLPDGARVAAVDVMTELWTGKPPANRCPKIDSLTLDRDSGLKPGAVVQATLKAMDPEGDPVRVEWALRPESGNYALGGAQQQGMPNVPGAVVQSSATGAQVKLPNSGGGYRLFVFVRDDHGGAATANAPLLVEGPRAAFKAPTAELPLVLYADGLQTLPYIPSGWMGKTDAIEVDDECTTQPHSGKTCMRIDYTVGGDWAGVVWQNPENDWGDRPGGFDLTGAQRLVAWLRGEQGGEKVELQLGIIGKDKPYHDSDKATSGTVTLTTDWQKVTIALAGKDLSCLKSGFVWVVAGQGKPLTFYLDDIRYE